MSKELKEVGGHYTAIWRTVFQDQVPMLEGLEATQRGRKPWEILSKGRRRSVVRVVGVRAPIDNRTKRVC